MHLFCSVLISLRVERTLSGLRAGHWRTCNNHALVLFWVGLSEGRENFVSWASSNKHALVLFCVDQPGAERNLSGLTAVHWRTLSCNDHAVVLSCVDQSRARNFVSGVDT